MISISMKAVFWIVKDFSWSGITPNKLHSGCHERANIAPFYSEGINCFGENDNIEYNIINLNKQDKNDDFIIQK